jgi:hypothetical protein
MVVVSRTCVREYDENDSKCDLATESRSMSDINRTLDTYRMRCSRVIDLSTNIIFSLNIRNCDPL